MPRLAWPRPALPHLAAPRLGQPRHVLEPYLVMLSAIKSDDGIEAEQNLLSIGMAPFWKSRLHTEGERRFVFCEASNEARDQEKERILKSALMKSAPWFLAHGNIDIDHITMIGHRMPKIANPYEWEIGRPVDVREGEHGPFVKGEIYSSEAPPPNGGKSLADWWWWSVTKLRPPMVWLPSVGGVPLPGGKKKVCTKGVCTDVVTECLWRNLAFAKEPQNLSTLPVSTVPIGEFAKAVVLTETNACDGHTCSCFTKAVSSGGYPTDSVGMTGGAAVRLQSIQGGVADPFETRAARFMKSLGSSDCEHTDPKSRMSFESIVDHFEKCDQLDGETARKYAHRLLSDIDRSLEKRKAA